MPLIIANVTEAASGFEGSSQIAGQKLIERGLEVGYYVGMATDIDPKGPGSRWLSQQLTRIWNGPRVPDAQLTKEELRLRMIRRRNDRIMRGIEF